MQKIVRRIAIVLGSLAVSTGLMGAVAAPAHAEGLGSTQYSLSDSSWGR